MRKLYALFSILLACLSLQAQPDQTVRWGEPRVSKTDDGAWKVEITARITPGWHIYDLGPYAEGGPTATSLKLEGVTAEGANYALSEPVRKYDEGFLMEIGSFYGEVTIGQVFRLQGKQTVTGELAWMACSETSCTPPAYQQVTFEAGDADSTAGPAGNSADMAGSGPDSGRSLWSYIVEAILWGFAALLTPCVFPMVPMTVSFFLKKAGDPRKGRVLAGAFGLSIVLLYTLPIAAIILITRAVGGVTVTADIFNWLATHWLPNVIFFIVFMLFAASFFGAFEITLPSKWTTRTDAKAESGGWAGMFFLALTLVLVSFSCTGPLVGNVVIKSVAGEFWMPIVTMFAFAVAFALPFVALALFPALLDKLPKSGGWLNNFKVTIGFVEVALGLKFLSVADQTYHWGILDREVYLAIWIVVFSLMGLYFLGKIRFEADSKVEHLTVTRLFLAIATFSFVVYLVPGMWGAPLKGISGYLPPMSSQDFVAGGGGGSETQQAAESGPKKSYSEFLHAPYGLDAYFVMEEGEKAATEAKKPLLVDVTGHGCVNCREMEAKVWSDPEVLKRLKEDFVMVMLYTDDKKNAPREHWVTLPSGSVLKSIGRINARLAAGRFGVSAQPAYLILGADGRPLLPARGYDLSVAGFVGFLDQGIKLYYEE